MSHTINFGDHEIAFRNITSLSDIKQIEKGKYVIMVQNEDTIDLWLAEDWRRGSNDLVRYYGEMDDRQINEEDLKVL